MESQPLDHHEDPATSNLLFGIAKCVFLSNEDKGFFCGGTRSSLTTHLIIGAQFLAVGREGEQPTGSIHHAANLQAVVVPSLPRAQALTRTHHVAIAAFHARSQREQKTKNNLDWGSLQSRLRTEMPPKPPGKLSNQPPIIVFLK